MRTAVVEGVPKENMLHRVLHPQVHINGCKKKPLAILTDNGEEFMPYQIQNILNHLKIQHNHTTLYHPQTNGRLKKFNDI